VADLPLRGAGGEPIDFARTIVSHGVAELRPGYLRERRLIVRGGAYLVRR